METEVSLEDPSIDRTDEDLYWNLEFPRERIMFVKSPGTEEFDAFLSALDEAMIVAMDAEWKPVRRAGVSPRVSILQMSCRIRKQSKASATVERILLARRIKVELEESVNAERAAVEKQRDELGKQQEKLDVEREQMHEEVELEKRKVRTEYLKKEREERKRREKKKREESEERRISGRLDDDVDTRPTMTKLQDGLKDLVLGRNGEISEVAADLAGGGDVHQPAKNAVTPKVNSEDAEQNVENLLGVLSQAQKELMKHQDGEQRTANTEAKLETLSQDDNLDSKSNYAFHDNKNLLEKNGLRSNVAEVEESTANGSFERNGELQTTSGRSGNEVPSRLGENVGNTESKSSTEEVTDTGSDEEDVSDSDREFSDAGENEFEVDDEAVDSVPELVRSPGHNQDGKGLTEEENSRSQGEEVIFVLDLLALSAADFALPMKKMLCSPRVLKLGFAFKNDQLHLANSFLDSSGCFDKVEPYIDISKLYKQLLLANPASVKHKGKRFVLGGTYSLTGISKAVLGHPLRKDAQCSDWEQRPLTEDQIYYAAADTHCLLAMFDALLFDALALISPPPAQTEAGNKPGLMIQQRAVSLGAASGAGLKFLTGMDEIREATPPRYIYTPKMATASQMVEAALRPSAPSSRSESVATNKQPYSAERFSKFVKKYSERLLVSDAGRSKSHVRRPRGRRARQALRNPDSGDELNLEWVGPAPWDVKIGGDGIPKFLCDVMVEGLARQLRCVGIDAASPPTKKSDPRQLVEQAEGEGRLLLTKDIKLLWRRLMPQNLAYFVKKSKKWEQLEEVLKVFHIAVSESELLSRCVKCNGTFIPRPLTSKEAKAQAPATQDIPPSVLETCEEYWQCSVCGHLFWQGFQFDRARQKFAAVCAKVNDGNSTPDDDAPIESLDIACEFLEKPEKVSPEL